MKTLIFILTCLLLTIPCNAETIIVDPNGSADFNNVQDAIFHAWDGDVVEVRQGVYQENILFTGAPITVTSTDPNDPNVVAATVITCVSGKAVTFDFGEGNDTVLVGFTIVSASDGIYCRGTSPTIKKNVIRDSSTGISGSYGAAPVIYNNKIMNNRSGGIVACDGPITDNVISGNERGGLRECNGTITGNIISDNVVTSTRDALGGGLFRCSGTIRGNIISDNVATGTEYAYGGGLYECNGDIIDNFISGNTATASGSPGHAYGGGLAHCDGPIEGNVISRNTARGVDDTYGGGLYNCGGRIVGNTIVGNKAVMSGNFGSGGGIYNHQVYPEVKNNIIAHNNMGGLYSYNCDNTYNFYYLNLGYDVSYAIGVGERRANPDFAVDGYWDDPCSTPDDLLDDVWVEGNYHLKSEVGRWDPNGQVWVIDALTSHAIDAGDPNDSVGYEPNPNGGRVNIGAYGGTAEASKSPSGIVEPVCTEYPAMDFNKDCRVDFQDFAVFTQTWLDCNLDPQSACWE